MVRSSLVSLFLIVIVSARVAAQEPPPFPPGTSQFFQTHVAAAVPAAGGGVWLGVEDAIVRYDVSGGSTVLPVPGGTPYRLALASDGSIWFANGTIVGRVSTGGALLEQYPVAGIIDITVAGDGAVWYLRDWGDVIGRIAEGMPVERSSLADAWSLATADAGAIWILENGLGTENDSLYRMAPDGEITEIPLGVDILYGELQTSADGTLYIGSGLRYGLRRLRPGATAVEPVPGFRDEKFIVDSTHNIWSATLWTLTYTARDGVNRFNLELPYDPRLAFCSNIPIWGYEPLALDSAGGLWMRVIDEGLYLPLPVPCERPEPPEMPTLIRLDTAALLPALLGRDIPVLSPAMLAALAAVVLLVAFARLRT
jgi:hypothetical protein